MFHCCLYGHTITSLFKGEISPDAAVVCVSKVLQYVFGACQLSSRKAQFNWLKNSIPSSEHVTTLGHMKNSSVFTNLT